MRPTYIPASLDGLRLRAQLAASTQEGWDKPAARQAGIGRLKTYLEQGRALASSRIQGQSGGLDAARTLAGITNAAVRALYDSVALDLVTDGARLPGVAVCAMGGYGAGELAPGSDVDLLFLVEENPSPFAETIVERTLYALWDSGVRVGGGALRTVQGAIELAQADVRERTALLDLRTITGDERLERQLQDLYGETFLTETAPDFASAKLSERDARVDRQGDSRYAVEPHVKDGKGGLRDLQTLRWLAQILYGADALERWVGDGLFQVADVDRYLSAADFFWTVRFHLHAIAAGGDDRLTFDAQPEIAARMGYADTDDQLAVEAFMRDYFRKTIDVGALTRRVCAKLEADALKDPPGEGRFMPSDGTVTGDSLAEDGFTVRAGRLDFTDPARIEADPVLMLRLFEVASARHLDLHPDAVAAISRSLHRIDDTFRSDPRAARSFFAVLLESDEPRLALRAMTEAGLLGAYIPEFGDIVARTQFNMYHRFTVDEHTLTAVGLIKSLERGQLAADHPLITELIGKIQNRRALYLAMLLHDTGKGKGDQCVEGAQNARVACARLGLDAEEVDLIAWLIAHHLDMSDTAQRRDISDPRTVLDFAELTRSVERLNLLAILTVADIRAVGPGIWNGWKAQLLRDLYSATRTVLNNGAQHDEAAAREHLVERAESARTRFRTSMARLAPGFAARWSVELSAPYWLAFSEADRLRHGIFARAASDRGETVSVGIRIDRRRSACEILVLAPDRNALFADIAEIIAAQGASVVGAQVTTTLDGRAFDVFYVQEAGGHPFGWADPYARNELKAAVAAAAVKRVSPGRGKARPVRRREAAFQVKPYVNLYTDAADKALVIEASGRDRPGLLHDLARTLAELGLDLESARIDGYGERAIDTFYVTQSGRKPDEPDLLAAIRKRLKAVLQEAEAEIGAAQRTTGLARAPMSAGR